MFQAFGWLRGCEHQSNKMRQLKLYPNNTFSNQ